MSIAFKNRTREEIIAAFRESIQKKQECMKQMDEIIRDIRQEEQFTPTAY
ncbi:MAG: 30S ribosomal protein S7 [Prevotella sp.]|nr:30S ribosomal protein S7 [Prevotella sp.]